MAKHALPLDTTNETMGATWPKGYKVFFDFQGVPHVVDCEKAEATEPNCVLCTTLPIASASVSERVADPRFNTLMVSGIVSYLHTGSKSGVSPYYDTTSLQDYLDLADLLCLENLRQSLQQALVWILPDHISYGIVFDSEHFKVTRKACYSENNMLQANGYGHWMEHGRRVLYALPLHATKDIDGSDWYNATKDMDVDLNIEARFEAFCESLKYPFVEKDLETPFRQYLACPLTQRGNPYHMVVPFLRGVIPTTSSRVVSQALDKAFACSVDPSLCCKILTAICRLPLPPGASWSPELHDCVALSVSTKCGFSNDSQHSKMVNDWFRNYYNKV